MSRNVTRNFIVCLAIVVLLPGLVLAADGAMAHPYGPAWLNGTTLKHASAIFPGDLVQTKFGSVLKIDASGSSLSVLSNSLLKFNGDSAALDHGSARLKTSTAMAVRAGNVTVVPASSTLTEFEITRSSGTVQVVALKGDLKISNGSENKTLLQGQQATQPASDSAQALSGGDGATLARAKNPAFNIEAAKSPVSTPPVKIHEEAGAKGSPIKP